MPQIYFVLVLKVLHPKDSDIAIKTWLRFKKPWQGTPGHDSSQPEVTVRPLSW